MQGTGYLMARAGRSLLLLALVAHAPSGTSGCSRAVRLKNPRRFTAASVRLFLWEDRCHLQPFFDSNPPDNQIVMERAEHRKLSSGMRVEVGAITYRITHPVQKRKFRELLQRYYRQVPRIAFNRRFQVTVAYYRYCGKPRMMRGSPVVVKAGRESTEMAYHPCVGAYLLNRDVYKTRPTIVNKTRPMIAGTRRPTVTLDSLPVAQFAAFLLKVVE